ncbi:unnamed protein product [Nesidiocoris tenuis]|uniref:Uncharacterized protein n=1 Tax=Nesidiocoris tenuis TaxID=355587 RepID=A0A6H5G1X3_9HEMI|nr:unnamed protein product [Nesidiocoris tenuis]
MSTYFGADSLEVDDRTERRRGQFDERSILFGVDARRRMVHNKNADFVVQTGQRGRRRPAEDVAVRGYRRRRRQGCRRRRHFGRRHHRRRRFIATGFNNNLQTALFVARQVMERDRWRHSICLSAFARYRSNSYVATFSSSRIIPECNWKNPPDLGNLSVVVKSKPLFPSVGIALRKQQQHPDPLDAVGSNLRQFPASGSPESLILTQSTSFIQNHARFFRLLLICIVCKSLVQTTNEIELLEIMQRLHFILKPQITQDHG